MKVFEGGAQLKNSDTEDYIFGGYIFSDPSLLRSFHNMDISALHVFTTKSCNRASGPHNAASDSDLKSLKSWAKINNKPSLF